VKTPLTYYGGKQKMAGDLVALMPPHRVYLEPFCGGAAVLFAKPRAQRETINDLDGALATFWKVVRDRPDELAEVVEATPYSREEFAECRNTLDDDVDDLEKARRLVVTIDQSYARNGEYWSPPSLHPSSANRWQPGVWQNVPAKIAAATARLHGVAVENTDAIPMLARWDVPGCLIYADPPYDGDHRLAGGKHRYRVDLHEDLWRDLVGALLSLEHAQVLLSGYPCEEAERLESAGWSRLDVARRRISRISSGDNGGMAPETLWLNYDHEEGRLFASEAA